MSLRITRSQSFCLTIPPQNIIATNQHKPKRSKFSARSYTTCLAKTPKDDIISQNERKLEKEIVTSQTVGMTKPAENNIAKNNPKPGRTLTRSQTICLTKPSDNIFAANKRKCGITSTRSETTFLTRSLRDINSQNERKQERKIITSQTLSLTKPVENLVAPNKPPPGRTAVRSQTISLTKPVENFVAPNKRPPGRTAVRSQTISLTKPYENIFAPNKRKPGRTAGTSQTISLTKPVENIFAPNKRPPGRTAVRSETISLTKPVENLVAPNKRPPGRTAVRSKTISLTKPYENIFDPNKRKPERKTENSRTKCSRKPPENVVAFIKGNPGRRITRSQTICLPKPPENIIAPNKCKSTVRSQTTCLTKPPKNTIALPNKQRQERTSAKSKTICVKKSPEDISGIRSQTTQLRKSPENVIALRKIENIIGLFQRNPERRITRSLSLCLTKPPKNIIALNKLKTAALNKTEKCFKLCNRSSANIPSTTRALKDVSNVKLNQTTRKGEIVSSLKPTKTFYSQDKASKITTVKSLATTLSTKVDNIRQFDSSLTSTIELENKVEAFDKSLEATTKKPSPDQNTAHVALSCKSVASEKPNVTVGKTVEFNAIQHKDDASEKIVSSASLKRKSNVFETSSRHSQQISVEKKSAPTESSEFSYLTQPSVQKRLRYTDPSLETRVPNLMYSPSGSNSTNMTVVKIKKDENDSQVNDVTAIIISAELLKVLVNDAYIINAQKKMHKIPSKLNVAKVIDDYTAMKLGEGDSSLSGTKTEMLFHDIIQQFNEDIHLKLLYYSEFGQYEEILKEYPGIAMSKIYPPVYLLRLLIRFDVLLPYSRRDKETLQWMLIQFNALTSYLTENRSILFSSLC